jgi:hypothetical protein
MVLAVAVEHELQLPALQHWAQAMTRRGPTLGQWLGVVRDAGRALVAEDERRFGLPALTTKGKSGFLAAAETLLQVRNDGQHGGTDLRRPVDVRRTLDIVKPALEQMVEQAQAMTAYPWLFVERLDYSEDRGHFSITAVEATGESPVWSTLRFAHHRPLQRTRLYAYARVEDQCLPLFPFCLVQDCRQCGNRELYVPESVANERLAMISIDSRHRLQEDAVPEPLARAVARWSAR